MRRLAIVTGRRTDPGPWLRRHDLDGLVETVIVNRTGLRSPHFKLATLRATGAAEHADDDPRTAQLIAQAAGLRVFLCDWPGNRGLAYDSRVERVADLADLARRLRAGGSAS